MRHKLSKEQKVNRMGKTNRVAELSETGSGKGTALFFFFLGIVTKTFFF